MKLYVWEETWTHSVDVKELMLLRAVNLINNQRMAYTGTEWHAKRHQRGGLVSRSRRSHRRGRGSIPRLGPET